MLLTEETSQEEMERLKEAGSLNQRLNIDSIFLTEETFQADMSLLKEEDVNISCIFVTDDVSQPKGEGGHRSPDHQENGVCVVRIYERIVRPISVCTRGRILFCKQVTFPK